MCFFYLNIYIFSFKNFGIACTRVIYCAILDVDFNKDFLRKNYLFREEI